jgi:uncharacterized protein involved in outer membrane biogenesis
MKKKLLILFLILTIGLAALTAYLNSVFLPIKIKHLIVSGISQATQKNVSLGRLEFSLFKGLVLRDLRVYDDTKTFLSVKEASCIFLLWPIFKKQIIIPYVRVKGAQIFVERRSDNTFNLADLFRPGKGPAEKPKFSVFVQRISFSQVRLDFQDDATSPTYKKSLEKADLSVHLSLPASLAFNLKGELAGSNPAKIQVEGKYNFLQQELGAQAKINGFSPSEIQPYLANSQVKFSGAPLDISANIKFRANTLDADISAQGEAMQCQQDKLLLKLSPRLKARVLYGIKENKFKYSGSLVLSNAEISGIDPVGKISAISGTIDFDNEGISAPKLSVRALGRELDIALKVSDFSSPRVNLSADSGKDISLKTEFSRQGKLLNLSVLSGHYYGCAFSLSGNIELADNLNSDLSGTLGLDLAGLEPIFKPASAYLRKAQPAGKIDIRFSLSGDLRNFKQCVLRAAASSGQIRAYGLRATDLSADYLQEAGIIHLDGLKMFLYGGSFTASGSLNLNSQNLPYWVSADLAGVKLEELKMDTPARDKAIAGLLQAEAKINGFAEEAAKINGAGRVFISEGKIWELNLFQGLGKLLFAQDFANIVFHDGSADFVIADKAVSSDNIRLKGDFVNLSGQCRIGFDGSLDASASVEVADENVPLKGNFKDVTTAIVGQAGRFGTIQISGTLKEPKYKFKPAVMKILDSLKDALIRSIEKN